MWTIATAAQQGIGLPSPTKRLTVDGVDVLRKVGAPTAYGVPIDSIEVLESAPGQVSSMSFTISDPAGELAINAGAYVRFSDLASGLPIFAGWVDGVDVTALGTGRELAITCVGVEAVLDWWYGPALTIPALTTWGAAVQAIVAGAYRTGTVQLRANDIGALACSVANGIAGFGVLESSLAVPAGTLRQQIAAVSAAYAVDPPVGAVGVYTTVDFYHNLRWSSYGLGYVPGWYASDYVAATITQPSGTVYRIASAAATAVLVAGSGTGSGIVTDGPNRPGPIATVSDANSTEARYRDAIARAYVAANGPTVSGEVTADELYTNGGAVGAERRAGMALTITDPNLGLSAYRAQTTSIRKTFLASGAEVWTFAFGARLSGAQLIRALTRTTQV